MLDCPIISSSLSFVLFQFLDLRCKRQFFNDDYLVQGFRTFSIVNQRFNCEYICLFAQMLEGLSHHVQSFLLYRSCISKDSARSTGHVGHFPLSPKKCCVACKKSTLEILIDLGFVTSFEDSHYILLFRFICGAQLIQWFCSSKHLHVNWRSYQ